MSDEISKRRAAWNELKDTIGCSLYEAQKLAEEYGHDCCTMTMLNKDGGIVEAKWLDAYMGIFQLKEDTKTFVMVEQIRRLGLELWVISMIDADGKNVPLKPETENTPG